MTTEKTDTHSPSPANTPLALKLSEGLGATAGPTHEEGMAFWANLVIANVWIATGDGPLGSWPAVIHLVMCVSIRWSHWRRQYGCGKSA